MDPSSDQHSVWAAPTARRTGAVVRLKSAPFHFAAIAGGSALLILAVMIVTHESAIAGPAILVSVLLCVMAAFLVGRSKAGQIEAIAAPLFSAAAALDTHVEAENQDVVLRPMPVDFADRVDWLHDRLLHLDRAFRALGMERLQSRESLAREKDRQVHFFTGLSHELRTPLNAILGYSSILIEEAEDAQNDGALSDLRRIQLAGRSLLSMVDDLLDMSGLDAARSGTDRAMVNLGDVITDLAGQFNGTGSGRCVATMSDSSVDAGQIIVDRKRLQRCLRALVTHATARAQGADVELTVMPTMDDSSSISICINDHGPVASVREATDLLESSLSQPQAGSHPGGDMDTGIAVARSLARSIDGDLRILPRVGGGLTRILILPRNAAQSRTIAMPSKPTDQVSKGGAKADTDSQRKVVLVIDDDPAAADLMSRWLARVGYIPVSASSGEEGLALTQSRKPDIILLDALMPGRSGYDILPELRAQTQGSDTPIILITVDDDRARGLDAGASDFVRKPIRESELRALVAGYDKDMQGDVLVIEDDDDAAELLSRNLRRLGFTPHRAADGAQGWEIMRSIEPRAVVLDLNMPRLNGFEFIERVTAELPDRTIPMLVFSGQDLSLVDYRKLNEAGCHFFLKGSASPRQIVTTLRELVA